MKKVSRFEVLTGLSRRDRWLIGLPALALVVAAFWIALKFIEPMPPRRIVLATGPGQSMLHAFGERYRTILARNGIAVEVRATRGAGENVELLLNRASGVDAAFLVSGTVPADKAAGIGNVSNLFYAALWALHRSDPPVGMITDLQGKRVAIGVPGSGLATALAPLLAANGITPANTTLLRLPLPEALRALLAGEIDVVFSGEGPLAPEFRDALRAPGIRLVDFRRADAYARRFPHITRLDLPAGTLDLARNIPAQDIAMIGTTVMIAAREGLHPTVIDLLVDAAREIHGGQGYFEKRGEFPNLAQVDEVGVSEQAQLYRRSGPSFLRRYLPLWLADFLQRAFTLAIPFVIVVLPLVQWLPVAANGLERWRIYNAYADLRLVEREMQAGEPGLDVEGLLKELDRIDREAASMGGSILEAGEIYTLRVHVRLVRDAVKALAPDRPVAPGL